MAVPRNEAVDNWRSEVNETLKDVSRSLQEVLVEVRQRPTRAEIEAMLAQKVNIDIFNAELKSVRDDISEIRQKPENMKSTIGTIVAVGGCAMTVVSIVLSTGIALLVVLLQHWK